MGRPARIDVQGCANDVILTPQQPSICINATSSVVATSIAGAAYSWSIDNGTITTTSSQPPSISFTSSTAGTAVIHLTVTVAGCAAFSTQVSVAVTGAATITSQPADPPPIAPGGMATLSVQATGSNLTYQWFMGTAPNTTYLLSGQTGASFTTAALSASTSYWVYVGSSCGSANSRTATVTVLGAPSSVQATTESTPASVRITWTAVPNATSYVVQSATNINGPFNDIGGMPTSSLSAEDSPAVSATPVAWIYRVVSVDGQGRPSPAVSPMDYAVTTTLVLFSDERLQKGISGVKAAHIQELRAAIDAVRIAVNLNPLWQGVAPPSGVIGARDVLSLLPGFNDARSAFRLPAFAYSGVAAPQSRGTIVSEHIQEVRDALR